MLKTRNSLAWIAPALILVATLGTPAFGAVKPEKAPDISSLQFQDAQLDVDTQYFQASSLSGGAAEAAARDLDRLGVAQQSGQIDLRSGRWASLLLSRPMIPGSGKGNSLSWAVAPSNDAELKARAWDAFKGFLDRHAAQLRIDPSQLANPGRMAVHNDGNLIQIWVPRVIDGVPVRDSYLSAVISHGNLILFGAHQWGDLNAAARAPIAESAAMGSVDEYLAGIERNGSWRQPTLSWVPVRRGDSLAQVELGRGLDYRLVWEVRPTLTHDAGRWEALVDASSGDLLAFRDTNHYGAATSRKVLGGVYPVSNDGTPPDGVEQAGWPMPFATVTTPSGNVTTDSGGNLPSPVDGNIASALEGPFIRMNDNCGPIALTSSGDLDFGTSGGDDCTTPGFGGAGNTHSSRTGFFELNRLVEMAKGQLPENNWLDQQLTSNMNINQSCNAFWNGSTINFYRSGGGCGNTGELAGVFDHEWGHGMDDNDNMPFISTPGEGIPDVYAALRLGTSCVGRGFFSGNCSGYGDPCIDCSGIRDIDWGMRQSGQPHDYTWSNQNCSGISHCQGAVYAESVWDLKARALPLAPYLMNSNTALEVTTRLTYIGAGNVGTWFSGGPPFGGCAASGGYLNYLAADDDNGDLSDGTPHMGAIFNAFNLHEIACATPTVQDSGCVGTPTDEPIVVGVPSDKSASLAWGGVSGATEYNIYRADGVFDCDFGKTLVGSTTSTSFLDEGLQNGREYYYTVIPMGAGDSCFGAASSCTTVQPASGPNLSVDEGSEILTIATGDGDDFLDNCEMATMDFDVSNIGLGPLSNVSIVSVDPVSHPGVSIDTALPALITGSLPQGGSAGGSFDFTAEGLSFKDTVVFQVTVTADELALDKSGDLLVFQAESDFEFMATLSYDFESGTDDWQVIEGSFTRTDAGAGGAQGTAWYQQSSAFVPDQCDHIRSPVISLNPTSTLSLHNRFDIEPEFTPGVWYDRANVGLYDPAGGDRTLVDPDGGRGYNASGANGTCGTAGQNGWAGTMDSWAESTFSSGALGAGGISGTPVQLDIRYGTDPLEHGYGFRFDQVTVTDVDLQIPDGQPNVCDGGGFVLSSPDPGMAGQMNDFVVAGASSGGLVTYVRAIGAGTTPLPCGGVLGVSGPAVLGNATADVGGDATLSAMVPLAASGRTIFFQAVDRDTCDVSNVIEYSFP